MKLHCFCFLEIHPVKKKKARGASRFIPTSHDSQHLGILQLASRRSAGWAKKKRGFIQNTSGIFSLFFTFVEFQVFLML